MSALSSTIKIRIMTPRKLTIMDGGGSLLQPPYIFYVAFAIQAQPERSAFEIVVVGC
jgi:hypothetical protein